MRMYLLLKREIIVKEGKPVACSRFLNCFAVLQAGKINCIGFVFDNNVYRFLAVPDILIFGVNLYAYISVPMYSM